MLAIGLMSGTSMDGVDASIMNTNGIDDINIIANHSIAYSKEFRTLLKAAEYSCKKHNGDIAKCHITFKNDLIDFLNIEVALSKEQINNFLNSYFIPLVDVIHQSTLYHLQVINELLSQANINNTDIAVIGYHGQTLFHSPKMKLSIAIGEPQFLANQLDTQVIFNFRQNDLISGGRGAPLVPIYHQAMASKSTTYPIALINCGGITNTTIINAKESIIAYDIGPGACLLDRLIAKRTKNSKIMDFNGEIASQGIENIDILQKLFNHSMVSNQQNFLNPSLKALDVNDFCLIPELNEITLEDACRNLIIFTAQTIIASFKAQNIIPCTLILAGGGWNNPVLVAELKRRWQQEISSSTIFLFSNDLGFNSQYVESQAFGYMAVRRIKSLPISFPTTTGVIAPTIGGDIFNPSLDLI